MFDVRTWRLQRWVTPVTNAESLVLCKTVVRSSDLQLILGHMGKGRPIYHSIYFPRVAGSFVHTIQYISDVRALLSDHADGHDIGNTWMVENFDWGPMFGTSADMVEEIYGSVGTFGVITTDALIVAVSSLEVMIERGYGVEEMRWAIDTMLKNLE